MALRIGVGLSATEGKRAEVNGARLRAAEQLRSESATLVFTPDRLAIVKAGPAARRAYFDRTLGRVLPARGSLSPDYAAALAQRNAGLKRGDRDALAPWTAQLASIGAELVAAREECLPCSRGSSPNRRARSAWRSLASPMRATRRPWRPRGEARPRPRAGATGLGPHLHDVSISSAGRDLRSFGSQGEQRTAVLALLLAEATLLTERREEPPLLLLDDVLSELDPTDDACWSSRSRAAGRP